MYLVELPLTITNTLFDIEGYLSYFKHF